VRFSGFFREKTALQIRKVIAESKATTEEFALSQSLFEEASALEHLATFWTLNKIATWDTVERRCLQLHMVLTFKTRGTSTILGLRPEPSAS